jgi:hypothetical protein
MREFFVFDWARTVCVLAVVFVLVAVLGCVSSCFVVQFHVVTGDLMPKGFSMANANGIHAQLSK